MSTVARRRGHLAGALDDLPDRAARTDDELAIVLLGDLGAQPHQRAIQLLPFAGIADERAQPVGVEVLGEVVIGAVTHRFDRGVEVLHGRHDDHFDGGVVFLEDPQHLESADPRQLDVQQHEVDVLLLEDLQRRFTGGHAQDAVILAQHGGHRVAHPLVVVDDEQRLAAVGHEVTASILTGPE